MTNQSREAWWTTMIEKYGSKEAVSAYLSKKGRKGGKKKGRKGFAVNRELAKKYGSINGKKFKRSSKKA